MIFWSRLRGSVAATSADANGESDDQRPKVLSFVPYGTPFPNKTGQRLLGWSPVPRAILKRKRKGDPLKDEVEDGGRAAVIEEGVAALVFDYARVHGWLIGVVDLDYDLLRRVKSVTSHLEVGRCSIGD